MSLEPLPWSRDMALSKQIAILCAAFFLGGLGNAHARLKVPVSPSDLVSSCTSTDPDQLAYCEGYMDGATHLWKVLTACKSLTPGDKSFCAGSKAVQETFEGALKSCSDCNATSLPDYTERMQAFRDKLKVTFGVCSPNWERRKEYCAGYNEEATNAIAVFSAMHLKDAQEAARDQGLGDGAVVVHMLDAYAWWGGPLQYYAFRPCIETSTRTQEIGKILIEFVRDHPEQLRGDSPALTLEKALFYGACPGPASGLKPHMELCTKWNYVGDQYGTKNSCDRPVFIQFMAKDQPAIEREVGPGEDFRTGLTFLEILRSPAIFAVCPVGYVSSVPFRPKNREVIEGSQYSCIQR